MHDKLNGGQQWVRKEENMTKLRGLIQDSIKQLTEKRQNSSPVKNRHPLTEEERDALEKERTKRVKIYNEFEIDWSDPESVKKSNELYNDIHEIARALDNH